MDWLGYAGGLILFAIVSWDVFVTVFSTSGGGFFTTLWTQSLWRLLLFVHDRKPIHRLLAYMGPLFLFGVILGWYVLLDLSWFLIFLPETGSIVDNNSKLPATTLEKLYFVGTTISSLGYGDFVPYGFPWTLLSNASALSGTIILTASLSYLLAIISAAVERKDLAETVFGIGASVPEFLRHAWAGDAPGALDNHILQLSSQIESHAHKHLNYPLLQFFHSPELQKSPSRATLLFSDALFLISRCTAKDARRPPQALLHVADRAIQNYAELTSNDLALPNSVNSDPPSHLGLDILRELGLPTCNEQEFRRALEEYQPRREKLVMLCYEDGWCDD